MWYDKKVLRIINRLNVNVDIWVILFIYFMSSDAAQIGYTFQLSLSHEFEHFVSLPMCAPRKYSGRSAIRTRGTPGLWVKHATIELTWRQQIKYKI